MYDKIYIVQFKTTEESEFSSRPDNNYLISKIFYEASEVDQIKSRFT